MTAFAEPQPGLVVSYSYLWSEEAERGLVEGRKDRPCAIVVAIEQPDKGQRKLDAERSWVILDEFNVFTWPGFDLRRSRDEMAASTMGSSRRSCSTA